MPNLLRKHSSSDHLVNKSPLSDFWVVEMNVSFFLPSGSLYGEQAHPVKHFVFTGQAPGVAEDSRRLTEADRL